MGLLITYEMIWQNLKAKTMENFNVRENHGTKMQEESGTYTFEEYVNVAIVVKNIAQSKLSWVTDTVHTGCFF